MKRFIKNLIQDLQEKLRGRGFETDAYSMAAAISRTKSRGLTIQTVIDIGASDGRWSLATKKYFPEAVYFLVEARKEHEPALVKVKTKHQDIDYVIAAAGDKTGQCYFDASDLFGGLASHKPFDLNCITVPITTIDIEVQTRKLIPPF